MKKGLIFLLIAVVATGAFAEVTGVGEATVSGSVSMTAGYDLDNEGMGFINDSSVTVTLPILDGSAGAAGDDGVYGEITVDSIGWQITAADGGFYDVDADGTTLDAAVSAKLVFNSLYMGLGVPDFAINNVDIPSSDTYTADANADAEDAGGGFSLGFKNEMIDIALLIASEKDAYDSATAATAADPTTAQAPAFVNESGDAVDDADPKVPNTDPAFVFGVNGTLTPAEGISVPFKFVFDAEYGAGTDALIAFGMAPSMTFGAIGIDIPVDFVMLGSQYGVETDPAITYTMDNGFAVATDFLFGMYEETVYGDMVADLSLTITEPEATGFVPGLEATLAVSATNMMVDLGWGVDVDVLYNASGLKPYVNFGYDSDEVFDLGLGVKLAADFTGIDNTCITIDYTNDGFTPSPGELGRITADVTVSF